MKGGYKILTYSCSKCLSKKSEASRLLIPFFLFLTTFCYSQTQKIDSLKKSLKKLNDTTEYTLLILIASEYGNADLDHNEALGFATQAREIAYTLNDTLRIVKACRVMGQLFNRLSLHVESEKVLLSVLPLSMKYGLKNREPGLILNSLAISNMYKPVYDKSLHFALKALAFWEERKDTFEISLVLNNIGIIYYKLLNFDRAIEYYERSLLFRRMSSDHYDLGRLLTNLSLCYAARNDHSKNDLKHAAINLEEACRETPKNHLSKLSMEQEFAKGFIELKRNNPVSAAHFFERSYVLASKLNDTRFKLENLVFLAKVYMARKDMKTAEKYLKESEVLGSNNSFSGIRLMTFKLLYELYTLYSNDKKTVSYQKKYIRLRDSIYNEELTQQLTIAQIEYEQQANVVRLKSQTEMLALKEESITRQENISTLTYIAAFLLLVLIVTLLTCDLIRKREMVMLERKVKARTQELEDTYEVIQKYYSEQTHHLRTTADTIKNCVSTINGLHFLLLNEMAGKTVPDYLQKVEEATSGLSLVSCSFSKVVLDGVGN